MNYHLVQSCKNTFVLFDHLETGDLDQKLLDEAHLALQNENRDDALLLIKSHSEGEALYLRMVVLGFDKSFGEFCGNGACATAAYLFHQYPQFKKFFLLTKRGSHPLTEEEGGGYSVTLPTPSLEWNEKFIKAPFCKDLSVGTLQGKNLKLSDFKYVEMIEPHLTIEGKYSDEELFLLGKQLNSCKEIFPLGINVNAWHFLEEDKLFVKTYERGVQRLTQSCGTGSMACTAASNKNTKMQVVTKGGILEVFVQKEGVLLKSLSLD